MTAFRNDHTIKRGFLLQMQTRGPEDELAIPPELLYLEQRIFEGLPPATASKWPEQLLSSIRPDAELCQVWSRFALWLLSDPADGVIQAVNESVIDPALSTEIRATINRIARLFRESCTDMERWRAAYAEARAVSDAAHAAYLESRRSTLFEYAAAWWAAWATCAAAHVPAGAADAAEDAVARAAAAAACAGRSPGGATYARMSEKLLELLRAA